MNTQLLWESKDILETPSFIFDTDELKKQINHLKKIFGENGILCYAMKANPFLVSVLKDYVEKFEVCSPGEFLICKEQNVAMDKIVLSGVNKTAEDVAFALSEGVTTFTAESLHQLEIINDCANKADLYIDIILRLSSGNQFGMDNDLIEYIVLNHEKWSNVHFQGLQLYSGTQKKKSSKITDEIQTLDHFTDILEKKSGLTFRHIEYGPGLGMNYFESEEHSTKDMLNEIKTFFNNRQSQRTMILEMGRIIASSCGYYISRVMDTKITFENKYCIIDGGINHINYYGQIMGMKIPKTDYYSATTSEESEKWNICGSLCTSADVIAKNVSLPGCHIGDLLVFKNIGAYSITEGIYLFLSRTMPRVYFYSNKAGFQMARDFIETYRFNMVNLTVPVI